MANRVARRYGTHNNNKEEARNCMTRTQVIEVDTRS